MGLILVLVAMLGYTTKEENNINCNMGANKNYLN
jgi:hypothetical protein